MNVPRNYVPNSVLRILRHLCLGLVIIPLLFSLGVDAKTPAAPKAVKKTKPASLKPMSGAQMDTYVPPSQFNSPQSKSQMLQGSAEHSESLPAEDSRLTAGATFDAKALPEQKTANNWFWIPQWFAGKYKTESITRFYRFDYGTGQTDLKRNTSVLRRNEIWGWQQDKLGGIWQYESSSYTEEVDRDTLREIQICKERVPVKITNDSVVLRFRITSIFINRKTEKIEWTIQSEYLQTYTPVSPTRLKVEISAKSFDENGKPKALDKNTQYLDRISEFVPVVSMNGRDVKAMFRDFLLARNRADLIPNESGF